jgi:hypothetical protein
MLYAEWILAKNPILYHIFPQAKVKYPNLDRILAMFSQKRNIAPYAFGSIAYYWWYKLSYVHIGFDEN